MKRKISSIYFHFFSSFEPVYKLYSFMTLTDPFHKQRSYSKQAQTLHFHLQLSRKTDLLRQDIGIIFLFEVILGVAIAI